MKRLTCFIGKAKISQRDTHTYFDWVFDAEYSDGEKKEFVFAKDYQIGNIYFEELMRRHLIIAVEEKVSPESKYLKKDVIKSVKKRLKHIKEFPDGIESKPRDDFFLQLNIITFTKDFVIFDFAFTGFKYIIRNIEMPIELYNELSERSCLKLRFSKDFQVFISHAFENKPIAKKIAEDLTNNGYRAWFDEWEIKVGDSIVEKINEGIKDTAFMIVLFSRCSVEKSWVKKEMNAGFVEELKRKKIYVLPALIEDCDIPPLFSDKRYADFTVSYELGINEILKSL